MGFKVPDTTPAACCASAVRRTVMADEDEIEDEITGFFETWHDLLVHHFHDEDMQQPLVICAVQANSVVQVFRYSEEEGMTLLLARDRTADDVSWDYKKPDNIMIVDRNGRAEHIVRTPAGIKYLR